MAGNNPTDDKKSNDDVKLTGTFISVMSLGVLMLISWIGIYALYLSR